MPSKPNSTLLYFTGFLVFLLSGATCARNVLASHHKAQLVFISTRDRNSEIYLMDADGENQIRLIKHPKEDKMPSWSPDGKKIAYFSIGGKDSFIVVMNTDGTDRRKLPGEALDGVPVLNAYPAWSPDGAKIAYYSGIRGEDKASIHLMTADGKHLKRLTNVPKGYDYDPDWFDPASLAVSPASNQLTIWGKLKKSAANLR